MNTVVSFLLRPMLAAWAATAQREAVVPRPLDSPHARTPGDARERVLLFGAGASVGWGVLSHDLALPGALSRALAGKTGRGVDVDVVAIPDLTVSGAIAALAVEHLWLYDTLVITLGPNEALGLEHPSRWRAQLQDVITEAQESMAPGAQVVIVSIQPLRSFALYDSLLGSVVDRHARVLNRVSAGLCDEIEGVTFVELTPGPRSTTGDYRDRVGYRDWAVELATAIVTASATSLMDEVIVDHEADRQLAVEALGIVDTEPEDSYDRIVALARRLFGTESAAFTVIDGARQFTKSLVGSVSPDTSRQYAFCDVTIRQRDGLIVSDASTYPRFKESPLVAGSPGIRFYAGYPIESPSGEPIGALCVFDTKPRKREDVDLSLLQQLAVQVQEQMRLGARERAGGV